jgi:hypothetical protein
MFHHSIRPEEYGLEYAYGILYYEIIDKPLFFLAVVKHGLEFEEVEYDRKYESDWYSQIHNQIGTFSPIIVCEDIPRK